MEYSSYIQNLIKELEAANGHCCGDIIHLYREDLEKFGLQCYKKAIEDASEHLYGW